MNIHEKFFSKIGINYLIYFIATIVFQIIIFNILAIACPEYLNDSATINILSAVANYLLAFPVIYWLMNKLDKVKIEKRSIGLDTFLLYLGITMTLLWIGNLTGLLITALLSGAMDTSIANPVQELINSTSIWFNLVIISIIAPIFEELIMRKLLIDRTIKYGAKVSIILSAVMFALLHGNLNQFFYALLIGGFFAYIYIRTGHIIYTIILHAIINLMGSVVNQIISNSLTVLQSSFNPVDLTIVFAYILFTVIFLFIGLYGLTQLKQARVNGEKTQIALKHPYRTMFLNYGMMLYVAVFIIRIINQAIG